MAVVMERMLAASQAVNLILHRVGMGAGYLFLVCTLVIVFDVMSRKFGFQLPGLGSTRLQELEWHLHTAIFCFWLGLGYIKNAHVRIDIALANAKPRTYAWVELLGCVVFALPYCLIAVYFSADFTWIAIVNNEHSPSANGLPWRWIPKAFITLGLILLLLAVISMTIRVLVYLFGPERLREQAVFADIKNNREAR